MVVCEQLFPDERRRLPRHGRGRRLWALLGRGSYGRYELRVSDLQQPAACEWGRQRRVYVCPAGSVGVCEEVGAAKVSGGCKVVSLKGVGGAGRSIAGVEVLSWSDGRRKGRLHGARRKKEGYLVNMHGIFICFLADLRGIFWSFSCKSFFRQVVPAGAGGGKVSPSRDPNVCWMAEGNGGAGWTTALLN